MTLPLPIFLLFLAGFSFFSWFASRLVVKQKIKKLITITQDISAGKGVHPDLSNENEFGQLAIAINTMAEALNSNKAELDFHKKAIDQHTIVAITNAKGVITYVNDKLCEVSQYSEQELIGNDHTILNSGFHPAIFFKEMWTIIGAGRTWQGVICNRKKDGTLYYVDTTILPHLGKDNKPDRYIAIRNEITEQVIAQEKLKQDKHFLNALLQHLHEGIMACDAQGNLTLFNQSMRNFVGLQKKDIPPQDWAEYYQLYHHDGKALMEMDDIPLIRALNGEHIQDVEMLVVPKNQPTQTLLTNGQALYDDKNNKLGAVISVLNITEKNQMEKQLHQAQKLETIGQLTGGIAHDFNNILASIMGYTELAMKKIESKNTESIEGYLKQVYQASERARDLISQMLLFSKSGSDIIEPIDVKPIVNEVHKLIQSILPSSIKLNIHTENNLPKITLNPIKLHQVLMNLCINASDAIVDQGSINVSVYLGTHLSGKCSACKKVISNDYVVLAIEDDGIGMSDELQKEIFTPFFTTKGNNVGTGIGLAVTKGIIHDANGHIILDSTTDRGTQFKALFPPSITLLNAEQNEASESIKENFNGHGKRVLIVDDEASIGRFEAELLTNHNYFATAETDSAHALRLFNKHPNHYDLLILDQTMPGITGFEMATQILNTHPEIPIILCTGYSELVSSEVALKAGIKGYITKPINSNVLLKLIKSLT